MNESLTESTHGENFCL